MSTIKKENTTYGIGMSDLAHSFSMAGKKAGERFNLQSELQELMKGLNDGERHQLHPLQKKFLIQLQGLPNQDKFTQQEQICIAHCIKYDHYSDIHRNTLNNLIRKYA